MLQPLREELELLPGPALADGQPSYTLHDPVRHLYFQLDWTSFEVMRHWALGDPEAIAAAVAAETPLQIGAEDVLGVARFLHENELLRVAPGQSGQLAERLQRREGGLWTWLLHNYLFFRIPLLRPDRWLGAVAPRLGFLYGRTFWTLTALAALTGLIEVARDWDRFTTTLVDTFSWAGMASYGVALVVVKVLHELGHAVTAKRLGCRVPTMGVAFLVLWPVAYTDTNEVWRLTGRRERLAVAAAGVVTELTIAVWATLAWALLPEGLPKSTAFMLATTTWVSSIALNASPFMRFDGYFLLADWLEMPNLHARASALARWDLRERLFALGDAPPELLTPRRRSGLILFAYATWAYRLVVFLGIAALVYAFFIKAVGILLFLVEIIWFVLLPPWRELGFWRLRWADIRRSRRARVSGLVVLAVLLLAIVPWPGRIGASALLRPVEQAVIYAPPRAQLVALPVASGAAVRAGDLLLQMSSPELDGRRGELKARLEKLRWQASAGAFDAEQRAQWQVTQEQLRKAEAEQAGLDAEAARYAPRAGFDGVLVDVDPELRPGTWLSAQEPLARLVSRDRWQVVAYLDEQQVDRVRRGSTARFYAEDFSAPVLALTVARVDPDASRTVAEAELTSLHGGDVLVRERKGQLHPEQAVYRVLLSVEAEGREGRAPPRSLRGHVVIDGDWSVPAGQWLRSAAALFWREAGF